MRMAEKCFESSLSTVVHVADEYTITNSADNLNSNEHHHICRSCDNIENISTATSTPTNTKQVPSGKNGPNDDDDDCTEGEEEDTKRKQKDCDCEKVDIYLETPVVDENTGVSVIADKKLIAAKPKRLSDEFFSADDCDVDDMDSETINDNLSEIKNLSLNCEDNIIINKISNNVDDDPDTSRKNNIQQEVACCSNSNIKININLNININNKKKNKIVFASSHNHFDDNSIDGNIISEPDYISEETSSCSNQTDKHNNIILNSDHDVQSIDAIERQDFENEQKLTGGIIIRNSSFISDNNRLNLGLLNTLNKENTSISVVNHKQGSDENEESKGFESEAKQEKKHQLTTTPTSSRYHKSNSTTKSAVKINLSASLDNYCDGESSKANPNSAPRQQKIEAFLNNNSNDSLSSEKSIFISNIRTLKSSKDLSSMNGPSSSKQSIECKLIVNNNIDSENAEILVASCSTSKPSSSSSSIGDNSKTLNKSNDSSAIPSTSTSSSSIFSYNCQFSENYKENAESSTSLNRFPSSSSNFSDNVAKDLSTNPASSTNTIKDLSTKSNHSSSRQDRNNIEDPILEPSQMSMPAPEHEHECDEDNWADCEEGSDEEVCTCRDYTDDDGIASSEDELPSRDVDLSSYTHLDSISDDILHDPSACNAQTPRLHRKRKLTENRILFGDSPNSESINFSSRKRLALDNTNSPRSSLLSPSNLLNLSVTTPTSSSNTGERKTPRTLIPTKDNPPPELCEWLTQFQRWTHVERLVAVDRLIEHCEPTQVRHMMKVIEPQFQRDFISLLPKELALQVLSYLEPKDLLRAAQTCRSWRFLADDNLLWKEKCKEVSIVMENASDRPKRGRAGNMPPISSPFKAAYMRQHIIEMNWRSRPIRSPKVLKGHDDHVITCLQFCGNRIVSGSDDNTLKVWSAITGKCLRTLVGHTGGVWSSQMSGNIIISGSTDRTLKVWNADTGQCTHTLYGHTSTVRCMHLHGNKVVSGSRDATLRVWDVNLGTCLHVLVGHLAAVRCVQYDGKLVVSGAYDYMVKVWNPERQECLHTLQGHTNRVYSLQFDGIHVVSGSLDTSIRVWDAETGSCKHALMGHQSLTSGMELRQNILVSGNADSTVKVWDIITGQCLQTLSGPNKHQSAVTCLQFNSRFVITSSDDGTVKLWDVRTGDFIRNLVALDSGGSGGVVWRIRANDTKLICAVGSRNGTEETKLMVLDFDVEGACLKCS